MFRNLEIALEQYVRFSAEELTTFQSRLRIHTIHKHDVVVKKGAIWNAVYFVNKGALKQVDENETVINLFAANEWMIDMKSFTSQKVSEHSVVAVDDCELFGLAVQDLHELIRLSPSFFQLGRLIDSGNSNFNYQNNRLTPEEKYELLLKEKPQYIQLFPSKTIASFLGIAPETLSRVRRKLIS